MRFSIALPALLLFAACADEALLCSEDPACQPVGCGPMGCSPGQVGGGEGGAGGAGGFGGSGGAGGAGGSAQVPPVCQAMCQNVYQLCGTMLGAPDGTPLSFDECIDSCIEGTPSQAQASCVAEAACFDWAPCLQPVPQATCIAVCDKVYESCNGALVIDGQLVDATSCEEACPTGLTPGQASCILGSSCTDWLLCVE